MSSQESSHENEGIVWANAARIRRKNREKVLRKRAKRSFDPPYDPPDGVYVDGVYVDGVYVDEVDRSSWDPFDNSYVARGIDERPYSAANRRKDAGNYFFGVSP